MDGGSVCALLWVVGMNLAPPHPPPHPLSREYHNSLHTVVAIVLPWTLLLQILSITVHYGLRFRWDTFEAVFHCHGYCNHGSTDTSWRRHHCCKCSSGPPLPLLQQWTTSPSVAQWKIKILKAQTRAPPLVPVFNNHHHYWPETMEDHLTTAGHFQWACFGLEELMID